MKVGIIGAGIICESHMNALTQVNGVSASCIADINKDRAVEFATKYNLAAYTDYKEMILKEAPDAVIIALPHFLHKEAGVYCMENGCHVLIEKPMAISTAACDRLIATAEKCGRTLFVGHVRYYFEEERLVGDVLTSGRLGKISTINIKRYCNYFYGGRPSWFSKPSMSGGGILANIGTHEVEKAIRYAGNIKSVKAFAVKREDVEVEGIVNTMFEHVNGIESSILLHGYSPLPMQSLEIICEKGMIRVVSGQPQIEILSAKESEKIILSGNTDPFVLQLKDFLNCVKTGSSPYLSGEYGKKVIDAVERIYLSAGVRYDY